MRHAHELCRTAAGGCFWGNNEVSATMHRNAVSKGINWSNEVAEAVGAQMRQTLSFTGFSQIELLFLETPNLKAPNPKPLNPRPLNLKPQTYKSRRLLADLEEGGPHRCWVPQARPESQDWNWVIMVLRSNHSLISEI